MRQTVDIDFEDIGTICFERSPRAKRTNISIKPPGRVRVAVPKSVGLEQAKAFVRSKAGWIKNHLEKMKQEQKPAPESDDVSEFVKKLFKVESERKIAKRVNELAGKYGFWFEKLSIRNQKTRWGSCSAKNNISLNFKIIRLPQELTDYVILHELTHTRIKNHSRDFWNELEKYVPGAKLKDAKLNKYKLRLL